ncbi:MAG: PEP-CTERM sorting domain-containing protein [Terriglobales bacterium]
MKRVVVAFALIAAVILLPIAARADSFTLYCTGGNNCSTSLGTLGSPTNYFEVQSTETYDPGTSGNWSDQIVFSAFGTASGYFQGFSLTLFPQNTTMTISNTSTVPAGYTYEVGKFNNGNNNCNTNLSGAVCVMTINATSAILLNNSTSLTFDFSGTFSSGAALTTVDLLANATTCQSGKKCGNTLAISQEIGGGTNHAPEPGSMSLLVVGLVGFAAVMRRRFGR